MVESGEISFRAQDINDLANDLFRFSSKDLEELTEEDQQTLRNHYAKLQAALEQTRDRRRVENRSEAVYDDLSPEEWLAPPIPENQK